MFSEVDACGVYFPHNNTLIVTMHKDNYQVCKILVDNGSSINILYEGALDRMEDSPEAGRAMVNPQTQSNLYKFDRYKS